jgi:hypothetical protein
LELIAPKDSAQAGGNPMWRICIIVLTAYNYGHPRLEAVRPAFLDQPLVNFHNDMDTAFSQGIRKIESGKDAVVVFVRARAERVQASLSGYFAKAGKI